MPTRPVERRREERGEGAESWNDDERKTLLKVGDLVDKWNRRKGKQKEGQPKDKSFLESIGISL